MPAKKYHILYLDDEPHNLQTFKAGFKWDYKIFTARSAFEGFDILEENDIHLIISDQRMPGLSGTAFFKRIMERFPDPIRIILTSYSDMDVVVRAINECGIYQFMSKPWKEDEMQNVIKRALETYQLRKDNNELLHQLKEANQTLKAENEYLKEEIQNDHNANHIITKSKAFKKILTLVERVASTNTTVLIRGESGTGKELLARAVYRLSKRNNKPLVKVNCAALPANLIESELFGHEKGAFTGATNKRIGRFELANGGTILLDEVGELPLETQSKLLRVLQEGEIDRVGSSKTLTVNVRIIAATNRNLEELVEKGEFREDLFYRLNVFPLYCPPLRERKEDIPLLIDHFLKKYAANIGRHLEGIEEDALEKLMQYDYPGNIRELENLIERFMITTLGNKLEISDWYPNISSRSLNRNGESHHQPTSILTMEEMEIHHIKEALSLSDGKVFGKGGAAEKLAMNPKTLFSRMGKLGIKK